MKNEKSQVGSFEFEIYSTGGFLKEYTFKVD